MYLRANYTKSKEEFKNLQKGNMTDLAQDLNSDSDFDSQEKLKQRREARRRKILENAKSRMEKLGVRNNSKSEYELQNGVFEYSDPEVEPNEIRMPFINSSGNSPVNFNPLGDFDTFATAGAAAEEPTSKDSLIFQYRLHVLISITLTYILAFLGYMNDGMYSIVIPTCICMALEVMLRKPKPVSPITTIIFALCKLPAREANIVWRLLAILYDIVVNLGLTIFCIVVLSLVNEFIWTNSALKLQLN